MDIPTKTEWVKRLINHLHLMRGTAPGPEQLVLMDAIETIEVMCELIDGLKENKRLKQ